MSKSEWQRCTSRDICPICGNTKWCSVSPSHEDAEVVCCMKVEDGSTMEIDCEGSPGYLHRLEDAGASPSKRLTRPRQSRKFRTLQDALIAAMWASGADAICDSYYPYQDNDGEVVFIKARILTGEVHPTKDKPEKVVKPISKTDDGGWKVSEPKAVGLFPLYNLPELLARPSDVVYVTEGEKAAQAVIDIGLLATTWHNPKSPGKTDWSPLLGRKVILLPDNDSDGIQAMSQVARHLAETSIEADVWQRDLPGIPDKGDAFEFIEEHNRELKLGNANLAPDEAARFALMIATIPPMDPEKGYLLQESQSGYIQLSERRDRLVFSRASDVEPKPVEWLWQGRIPIGKVTLIAGEPGVNKSFLTTYLTARVSRGDPFHDEKTRHPPGTVVMLNAEDDPEDTIRPRLDSHNADASRVILVQSIVAHDKRGEPKERMVSLSIDLARIDRLIACNPDCRLLVIDPLNAYLGGVKDSYRDSDIRQVLGPLNALAMKRGIAVVVISHFSKGGANSSKNPLDRVLGSIGVVGAARSVWAIIRDPTDAERRLWTSIKQNNAPDRGVTLAYRLVTDSAIGPHIAFEDTAVDLEAEDVFEKLPTSRSSAIDAAGEWLTEVLADGPMWATSLRSQGDEAGHAWRTLQRAKERAGIKSCRAGDVSNQRWYWHLPRDEGRIPADESI